MFVLCLVIYSTCYFFLHIITFMLTTFWNIYFSCSKIFNILWALIEYFLAYLKYDVSLPLPPSTSPAAPPQLQLHNLNSTRIRSICLEPSMKKKNRSQEYNFIFFLFLSLSSSFFLLTSSLPKRCLELIDWEPFVNALCLYCGWL